MANGTAENGSSLKIPWAAALGLFMAAIMAIVGWQTNQIVCKVDKDDHRASIQKIDKRLERIEDKIDDLIQVGHRRP